jgi:hypothetical protein
MSELQNSERPVDSHVTMRSDQAWQLLHDAMAKSQEPIGQSVLAVGFRDAAALLIRACQWNGAVTFPESIKTALIELSREDTSQPESNIIALDQDLSAESCEPTSLPLSA